MRGIIRIGGAAVFGIAVIAGAILYAPEPQTSAADETLQVAEKQGRQYIPVEDSDNDGINDWQEQFTQLEPLQLTEASSSEPYSPPETVTGKFALTLFEDLMRTGMYSNSKSGLDEKTQEEIIERSLSSVEMPMRTRQYVPAVLTHSDNSLAALHDYGNALASVLLAFASTERDHELNVLGDAFTKEEGISERLQPIRITYQQFVNDLLQTPVPPELAGKHLRVVNLTQAVYESVSAFEKAGEDPLLVLAYLNKYEADRKALTGAFFDISDTLFAKGVHYESGEPAATAIEQFELNYGI